jgi:hypothetical protein
VSASPACGLALRDEEYQELIGAHYCFLHPAVRRDHSNTIGAVTLGDPVPMNRSLIP